MSQTRILCEKCGVPQVYCKCTDKTEKAGAGKPPMDREVSFREAFEAAEKAAEYLGNILNNMDAVSEEDIEHTTPLFRIIHAFKKQEAN